MAGAGAFLDERRLTLARGNARAAVAIPEVVNPSHHTAPNDREPCPNVTWSTAARTRVRYGRDMDRVRSLVDELTRDDVAGVSDDDLEASLLELERVSASLEAERARRVDEVARRGAFRRDGFLSTTAWLAARLRIGGGAAARYVRWARVLRQADLTRRALAAGDITMSAATTLIGAAEVDVATYRRDEALLLRAARSLSGRDLVHALGVWRQHVDESDERAAERAFRRRRLHVSPTIDGMVRLDGDLDAETGNVVLTALRSVVDADLRGGGSADGRTPAQRRADALGEICRRYLDDDGRPKVAGERPHLLVVVEASALGDGPARATIGEIGTIPRTDLRRLACDASVSRVITRGGSEPLDVGRRTPVVSPAMRRALIVRDAGCRFPGCDRPHAWCDAHHVVHWADGGDTAMRNLLLLCRPHHRAVHRSFSVATDGHEVVFRRADGSLLAAEALAGRAPP